MKKFRFLAVCVPSFFLSITSSFSEIYYDTLENGLKVVTIEDNRSPMVTSMVWYGVGAADDIFGQSGVAHFLEHLMFKDPKDGTKNYFSETVASLGGSDNAFTTFDFTSYYQQIHKDFLPQIMDMEATRMSKLAFAPDGFKKERQVIIEERRMRVDNNPDGLLHEQVLSSLFRNHPYGRPNIGWLHEMKNLSMQNVKDFYEGYYTPSNAVLVLSGDITHERSLELANKYYASIKKHTKVPNRIFQEPPQNVKRQLTLNDEKVSTPSVTLYFTAPSTGNKEQRDEVHAMRLASDILGGSTSAMLYKDLVVEKKIAVSVSVYYLNQMRDYGMFMVSATPAEGTTPEFLEAELWKMIDKLQTTSSQQLKDSAERIQASEVYSHDGQEAKANFYGAMVSLGLNIDEIKNWSKEPKKISIEQVKTVAKKYLTKENSVAGYLLPKK